MILKKLLRLKKQQIGFLLLCLLFVLFANPTAKIDTDKIDTTLKVSTLLPCYTGCPGQYGATAFYDFKLQECWSCPKGYSPTLEGVYSRRACKQYTYGLYADARRLGKLACGDLPIAFQ